MFQHVQRLEGIAIPNYRGRSGSTKDLLPEVRLTWAQDVWADREQVAKMQSGPWMLRQAVAILGLPAETADEVIATASHDLPKDRCD